MPNIQMNDRMVFLDPPDGSPSLPAYLEQILQGGFITRDGCFFFRKFAEDLGDGPHHHFDDIGFECLVNHFHFQGDSDNDLVSISLEFCRRAHAIWDRTGFPGKLRFIVCVKDRESTFRFHLFRRGQSWLADDLNVYKDDAILIYDT